VAYTRRATQPHLVKRPCRQCRTETPALKNGQLQDHPLCPRCEAEFNKAFQAARRQADAQFFRARKAVVKARS
jgi:predicted amidophosphoribosyltransferase